MTRADPWTQRFMDEALKKKELLFLQGHLMTCQSCSRSLALCRDLYYRIEGLIPQWESPEQLKKEVEGLERALTRVRRTLNPNEHTFGSSLEVFLERWDVRIALALLLAVILRLFF